MHPRNLHQTRYPISELIKVTPALASFTKLNPKGEQTIDFADPAAVKTLNQALLHYYYGVKFWDIPQGYLCPPIPGRADYLHHIADLLAQSNDGNIPKGKHIIGLDIGTGANLAYPLIGNKSYGWRFIASDIDPISVQCAQQLCQANKLTKEISVFHQPQAEHYFLNILQHPKANLSAKQQKQIQQVHFTMCNPPFHTSLEAAQQGTQRKITNLAANKAKRKPSGKHTVLSKKDTKALNFGGQQAELWCEGGEAKFITDMIIESQQFSTQSLWFTSLVSNKDNLKTLKQTLKKINAKQVKVVDMSQGNKQSRFIAWSFFTLEQQRTQLRAS
ncbi:23S rRNA (adenine(1618)-N(6))-methyltransferase RlmF [Flocculibacter collagenilyticus]|uniref:23S rRNA (adenine(1618)-N(6))-methyltransferase RlmF n=1 Tax=Flocculibacter collagenilyticus TaxID=2744479 RepID=UPI0018F3F550|nr:23S rRNA (adenine(1618)-N(6))-methyltransferase RlmF [Flocculibacter collagenilyticus]